MWDKDNRPTYIRRGILALLILLTAMFQNTRGAFPTFFGAHAILLIPLVVIIAMFERGFAGMFFGLFAGILCDICTGGADGFYAIIFTVTGFLCGTFITYFMRNNIVTAFVLGASASFICCTLYWLFFVLMRSVDGSGYVYIRYYMVSVLYTTAFVPLYYLIVMKLCEKIKVPRRTFTF